MARVSRRARRAVKTKKQPDSQLLLRHQDEIRDLRNLLRRARDQYHNVGNGKAPIMSDEEYDKLEQRLRTLSPNDKLLTQIGAPLGKAARKTTLPFPMPSLDKVKPNETLEKWLKRNPGPYTVSDKIDGMSAMRVEQNSEQKLYTRGNGVTGSDISHLLPFVRPQVKKLPNTLKAVRGELAILRDTFTRKYAKTFENSRNLAGGIVNAKDVKPAARDLVFFVHGAVHPYKPLGAVAQQLKQAGFLVVPHVTKSTLTEQFLLEYLARRREKSKVEIDGLVIATRDSIIAFKAGYESAQVEVKEIRWQVSRYGYLKPKVILKKSVKLAGANISQLTAHNAAFLVDNGIAPGAIIEITRSGEVIPKIMRCVVPSKRSPLPAGMGTKYEWNDTEVDLVTINGDHDFDIKVKELVTFLIRIEVDKVKDKVVEKLVKHGIDTIPKLVKADVKEMQDAGLGHATSSHLHSRMAQQLKVVKLPALMAGSNKFGRGFGETKLGAIIAEVPFKQQLVLYKTGRKALFDRVSIIPGIGLTTAQSYVASFRDFVKFLQEINWKPTKRIPKVVKRSALGLNPIVVFTGFRDKGLALQLEKVGGRLAPSVTKNTTHVVTLNVNSNSTKIKKALRFGARVMDVQTFRRLLNKTT